MENRRFLVILGVITAIMVLLLASGHFLADAFKPHTGFSFAVLAMYVIFSLIAYQAGKSAVQSTNKYRFIQVLIIIIMGKIFLSLLFFLAYMKLFQPADKLFVIPFILIYLIYTVFEVYYLEKIAKEEPANDLQGNHQ